MAVVVEGVGKSFGDRIRALDDVSLTLAPGEFVLLTGPSGSGKSTLLNLVAGFDRPDAGTIVVGGLSVADLDDAARFRRDVIGVVFQLHHLIPGLTAEENVEVPLIPDVRRRSERLRRARAALADVGLEERRTHLPAQLSGGERQRVAIARAMVRRPRLLLADEPTGALDSAASDEVLELLAELSARHGTTVLLVSHEPEAERHVGRVLRMRDGRLEAIPGPAPA
ncbi:MAG TPA: ABC transporter ATP-binding protein [Solirubrobacteraceae bacterium]|nr:ABC transporter ATP-binding protein [Solirubrobacteraceae bacterium]